MTMQDNTAATPHEDVEYIYPAGAANTPTAQKRRVKGSIRETLWMFAIAVVIVAVLRLFVFEVAAVDGRSMQPTIQPHQRVVVMKWTQIFRPTPKRGEVIVTKYPGYKGYFIKRCIAVPGDTVRIEGGLVYVNHGDGDVLDTYGAGYVSGGSSATITIAEGHIYVLGDHRAISMDSHNVGQIPVSMVFGRADYIVWPLNEMQRISFTAPAERDNNNP